jgi:glycosyltransferase involved in cell wall biosynthesis
VTVVPIGIGAVEESQPVNVRTRYNLPEKSVIAVTSGRFVEQKGHHFLIEAARQIVPEHPEVRFLWLGDGPLRDRLTSRIKDAGLADLFIMPGMVDDVSSWLDACDLMIHPSIEEPFGIAILEGMRAGLPVVASRVGGIPEVVGEGTCALLAPPADSGRLAEAVSELLSSADERTHMGRAGYRLWQEQFTLTLMIDRVEDYLEHVRRASEKAHGLVQED